MPARRATRCATSSIVWACWKAVLAETQNQRLALESLYLELTSQPRRAHPGGSRADPADRQPAAAAGRQRQGCADRSGIGGQSICSAPTALSSRPCAARSGATPSVSSPLPYVDVVGMSLRLDALASRGRRACLWPCMSGPPRNGRSMREQTRERAARLAREAWHDIQKPDPHPAHRSRGGAAAVAFADVLPAREPAVAPDERARRVAGARGRQLQGRYARSCANGCSAISIPTIGKWRRRWLRSSSSRGRSQHRRARHLRQPGGGAQRQAGTRTGAALRASVVPVRQRLSARWPESVRRPMRALLWIVGLFALAVALHGRRPL